jgi:hypothetical protein
LPDLPEKQDSVVAPTDDDIVAHVINLAYDDDREGEVIPARPTISVRDATVMVSDMERLLLQYPVEYAASLNALQNLRKQFSAIVQRCTRQSDI